MKHMKIIENKTSKRLKIKTACVQFTLDEKHSS